MAEGMERSSHSRTSRKVNGTNRAVWRRQQLRSRGPETQSQRSDARRGERVAVNGARSSAWGEIPGAEDGGGARVDRGERVTMAALHGDSRR
jgi:hypothetical protein